MIGVAVRTQTLRSRRIDLRECEIVDDFVCERHRSLRAFWDYVRRIPLRLGKRRAGTHRTGAEGRAVTRFVRRA